MGCDIHTRCERYSVETDRYEVMKVEPDAFDVRFYGLFGWLANVRNYSAVTPISEPRGIPDDTSPGTADYFDGYYACSCVTIQELLDFDYTQMMEDRRVMIDGNGGCTAEPGDGEVMTYAVFLGPWYFTELLRLRRLGVDRVLFGFDN